MAHYHDPPDWSDPATLDKAYSGFVAADKQLRSDRLAQLAAAFQAAKKMNECARAAVRVAAKILVENGECPTSADSNTVLPSEGRFSLAHCYEKCEEFTGDNDYTRCWEDWLWLKAREQMN